MTSAVDFVVCHVEGKTYPRATCHRHHKDPRHAGGSDSPDNLVWLSANSHQLVHRAAQLIKSGRGGSANDLAMAAYGSPSQRNRFMKIVRAEVDYSARAKIEGTGRNDVVVEVLVPKEAYLRLKLLVSDRNTKGRKLSIAGYVSSLIQSHVRESF